MKTRDRIILTSLELFNEQGERNVSTNHIAAALGISPGNLYYHFRNKTDIIHEIFRHYQLLVDHYLQLPEGRALQVDDEFDYLEAVFDGLWSYRFLHRDLEHYLESDPRLKADYRAFTQRCLRAICRILDGLADAGILMRMSQEQLESMSLNVWLVVTSWMAFLKTSQAEADVLCKERLKEGIYQVITLQLPYLQPEYRDIILARQQAYLPASLHSMFAHARG
ncbi:MAG: TetR/AcrR family transcriptional regulator [Gammaproteobacteria bacterium]|nr:MAG: TetR/AcrR family transcriptional regulator [Gammaproteobacteria bacterium]